MEEERWAIWQSNVRYALHQCVATLQCRFQNINANTCLLCPASGQWSLFFFCICSNSLWHNAYTLAEGGADGPTYEALWRFWEIYVWKCHGWNVTYWVCMFHIDFPSSRGKEVCDSDVCAEMSAHWYQIRAEQQNTEDGGHGYLLRVVEAIGVCEGVVSCVQSGRCCESATFKTEDEKIESFIQQYIWDKCLKIKYWALL